MHACGHDTHIATYGTAEVLASVRKNLKGTVKFIFNLQKKAHRMEKKVLNYG
jgi:metal-dependent amidase/aminoacylase/carboxypeptidase family protein